MITFNRICIEDAVIEAQNGDRQELKRGQEYTTSAVDAEGMVVVFSRFWVRFPVTLFAGEKRFT